MIKFQSFLLALLLSSIALISCGQKNKKTESNIVMESTKGNLEVITLGAGCFWCVEAIFEQLNGVVSVKSGYMGGSVKNPAYKEVCNGTTGHAEVAQVTFDPMIVSVDEVLEVFWKTHDPTTMNRQGADVGTQYRSAVFYHNENQRARAEFFKEQLNINKAYPNPVITEITEKSVFYEAEDYHQNYFEQNGEQSYCKFVIQPKVEKFQKAFKDKVKH